MIIFVYYDYCQYLSYVFYFQTKEKSGDAAATETTDDNNDVQMAEPPAPTATASA